MNSKGSLNAIVSIFTTGLLLYIGYYLVQAIKVALK